VDELPRSRALRFAEELLPKKAQKGHWPPPQQSNQRSGDQPGTPLSQRERYLVFSECCGVEVGQ
jgi:hypothetical protein